MVVPTFIQSSDFNGDSLVRTRLGCIALSRRCFLQGRSLCGREWYGSLLDDHRLLIAICTALRSDVFQSAVSKYLVRRAYLHVVVRGLSHTGAPALSARCDAREVQPPLPQFSELLSSSSRAPVMMYLRYRSDQVEARATSLVMTRDPHLEVATTSMTSRPSPFHLHTIVQVSASL
jgi:hypothetical protein